MERRAGRLGSGASTGRASTRLIARRDARRDRSPPLRLPAPRPGPCAGRRQQGGARRRPAQPAGQDRRAAQPAGRPSSPQAVAALRAERRLLGGEPGDSADARSAPGRSGTSRTSNTSSPGPTRPSTASWSSSPTPAIKAIDPGAKIVLGGLFAAAQRGELQGQTAAGLLRHGLPRQLYKKTPGIKSQVRRGRPAPVHLRLPGHRRAHRRIARGPQGRNHDPQAVSGSPSSAGAPRTAAQQRHNGFEKGPRRPGEAAQGRFQRCSKRTRPSGSLKQVFWFSVDDRAGVCNFCDGSGLFGPGFIAKPSWKAYVKFAGGVQVAAG